MGVKGGQVRIGINAPKEIAVHREEIYNKILNQRNSSNPNGYKYGYNPLSDDDTN